MRRCQEQFTFCEGKIESEKEMDKETLPDGGGGKAQGLPLQRRGGVCVPRLRKEELGWDLRRVKGFGLGVVGEVVAGEQKEINNGIPKEL